MRNEEFAAGQPSDDLTDDQKKVIDFAKRTYRYPGAREEAILSEFGYRGTTFFRKLNDLLDHPAAMAYDPQTINRYRRTVDAGLTKWGHRPRYSDGGNA